MFSDIVILAGGFGERLWPASSPEFPKQFLSLEDGISFLQNAVLRALALEPAGKIIIVTRGGLEKTVAAQCRTLAERQDGAKKRRILRDVIIIAEPQPRHTTAPVILSCRLLELLAPDTAHSMLVLTSDHIIGPTEKFAADAETAYRAAADGRFVCFGVRPDGPSVSYGYIQTGGAENAEKTVFRIEKFQEKPDAETAAAYIARGDCWWNSGMFAFFCPFFTEELRKCAPEIYSAFADIPALPPPEIGTLDGVPFIEKWPAMDAAYARTPAVAIDRAVAERTQAACVVPATFTWDDIGSWDSFRAYSSGEGKTALIESSDCFVYSDIPVAVCGLDGVTVVIKNNRALVMKKGAGALVREAARRLGV